MKFIAYFAALLTTLTMGVLWGTWISLGRSIRQFSPEFFVGIGKTMIHNLAKPMRALMLSNVAFLALTVFLTRRGGYTAACLLATVGLACMILVLAVTLVFNVPIDLKMRTWQPTQMPEDWQYLRVRWSRFHLLRTALSVVGIGFILAALLMV